MEPHVRRALTHSEGLDALAPLGALAPHELTGVIGTPSKSPPSLNEFIQDIARPIYTYIYIYKNIHIYILYLHISTYIYIYVDRFT